MFRRRRFGQNADPVERIFAVKGRKRAQRDTGAADAVESVTTTDEITDDFLLFPGMQKANFGRHAAEIMHADSGDLKQDLCAVSEPARDQILDHLLLAINGHAL